MSREGIMGRLEGLFDSVFVAFEQDINVATNNYKEKTKGAFRRFITNMFSDVIENMRCYFICGVGTEASNESWTMWATRKVVGTGCVCGQYGSGTSIRKLTQKSTILNKRNITKMDKLLSSVITGKLAREKYNKNYNICSRVLLIS
jgi:hypothetical protein